MKFDIKSLLATLLTKLEPVKRYRILIFMLFLLGLYGYLVLQVNQASNVQPTASQDAAATKTMPRIDPQVVKQLQQLQDNSVSVQALFNEARTNPFQ